MLCFKINSGKSSAFKLILNDAVCYLCVNKILELLIYDYVYFLHYRPSPD